MTRRKRFRRVGKLCCHCLRNLAFRNAGWHRGSLVLKDQFWVTADGNVLDIAVLEWCKLFADQRGKHFWRKVITQPQAFFEGLLKVLGVTEVDFEAYIEEVKTYRDRFIAHLDDDEQMQIQNLQLMRKVSLIFTITYLLMRMTATSSSTRRPVRLPNMQSTLRKAKWHMKKQHNNAIETDAMPARLSPLARAAHRERSAAWDG